ncbi:MAG: SAM-dependent methyltransferase [Oscillospiraceae bacterium]|nr:SAM-dependent methyltransferase [Oscillospiraceae bacterium]
MNRRLECLLHLLPKESRGIIDVGTDHAQIPIALAEEGYGGNILASDIAEGPLRTARAAACEHRVDDRIRFLCCDGLDLCPSDAIDTILIAGMGGDTICGILDRTEWIFNDDYCLVLQPMTHAEVVRYWLVHNGFRIKKEAVIAESGHVYQMFCAGLGKSERYLDADYLTGRMDSDREGDDPHTLLLWERERLIKKRDGLRKACLEQSGEARFYENILLELEERLKNADRG